MWWFGTQSNGRRKWSILSVVLHLVVQKKKKRLFYLETCKKSNQMRQTNCFCLFLVKCFLMIMESSPLRESCNGTTNCYSLTLGCRQKKELIENWWCAANLNLLGDLNTRKQSFDIEIVLVEQGNTLRQLFEKHNQASRLPSGGRLQ